MLSLRSFLIGLLLLCALVAAPVCVGGQQADELAARSRQAKQLMAEGKFKEAVPIYRELARRLPRNAGLVMNLGLALHMAGEDREAIRQFEAALKLDPQQLSARLFLGASYLALGEAGRAVAPIERVVRAQPVNADARGLLAEALASLERYEEATVHYRRLTELAPQDPKAWSGLGRCYEALSQRAFEALGQIAPGSPYWLGLVAESRVKQHQYGSAFYLYRQALLKMPTLRGIHHAVAEVYRSTGHPDWATAEEEKERALAPPDCAAARLECEFSLGRFRTIVASAAGASTAESYYWRSRAANELAVEAYSHLFRLSPSGEVHQLRAKIFRDHRQYRESAREWQEALKFEPGNPRIQKELAVSLSLSHDAPAAEPLIEELLKREPESAELNFLQGNTMLDLQKADEAVPYLTKAIELDPTQPGPHASLARAFMQLGEAKQAIPHLKAALSTDEDGNLHYQLSRAYQIIGEQALAEEALKQYQEIRKAVMAGRKATEEEVQITPP